MRAERQTRGALPEIPGFRVRDVLAAGGMGTVLRAQQLEPARDVAIKVLNLGLTGGDGAARMKVEAAWLTAFDHPGIPRLFGWGEIQSPYAIAAVPWFAMELLASAEPITTHAARASLAVGARLGLLRAAADVLAHVHEAGAVHRDVKPANLLVDSRGQVRLLDFGVACARRDRRAFIAGTPRYMAPEAAEGALPAPTADVHALGVVMHELLLGHSPSAPTPGEARRMPRLRRPVRPRRRDGSRLPRAIETVLLAALEPDAAKRYPDAGAMRDDLDRVLAGKRPHARRRGIGDRLRTTVARHRVLSSVAAILLLGLVLGVAHAAWRASQPMLGPALDRDVAALGMAPLAEPFDGLALWTMRENNERRFVTLVGDDAEHGLPVGLPGGLGGVSAAPIAVDRANRLLQYGGANGSHVSDIVRVMLPPDLSRGERGWIRVERNRTQLGAGIGARASVGLAYDAAQDRFVLYGGAWHRRNGEDGNWLSFDDTYAIRLEDRDGSVEPRAERIAQEGPSPGKRELPVLAYAPEQLPRSPGADAAADAAEPGGVMLFGGMLTEVRLDDDGKVRGHRIDTVFEETWWLPSDGRDTWQRLHAGPVRAGRPAATPNVAIAYDDALGTTVLIVDDGSTWCWSRTEQTWLERIPAGRGPGALRGIPLLVRDRVRQRLVLAGVTDMRPHPVMEDTPMAINAFWELRDGEDRWRELRVR